MEHVKKPNEDIRLEIPIFLHWIGRFYYWLTGWKIAGEVPQKKKLVVVLAPHTTNWDGILLVATCFVVRRRFDWMVKAEWTRGLVGVLTRALGAIGIDRSASFNTVEQMIHAIHEREQVAVMIPPEGTRRKTNHWKTGFYWIAHGAGVPLLLARINYGTKTVDIDVPLLMPTGDIEADMEEIWCYYEGVQAKYPEKVSDFKLRPSGLHAPHSNHEFD